ncbi:MAG TPA: SDR family oxidoreductase [Solirubrobacteraceae bacterium]|nr:SDR family oxidoreductase [Solirubrobacteraceae bacterium]
MRVFVTGASGHVGSAVIPELLQAGHEVVGLARSDQAAAKIEAAGATVRRGSLDDLELLAGSARESDAVIHLAFRHDWMVTGDFDGAVKSDLDATIAIGEALAGSGKPLVTTSGTGMLAMGGITGRLGTEQDVIEGGPRVDAENYVIGLAGQGVRSAVVRLPPTVHSDLDHHGFVPTLINIAREKGYGAYIGEGDNRWSAGNTRDAGHLYRLAVESAPAGSRLHAVGDEGVPFREIEETFGRMLGLPVRSIAPEGAEEYYGFLARFAAMDSPASSALTRSLLGWEPSRPGLIADLELGHYFKP